MSASNFNLALSVILKHEGGYVDHPSDPGGATNKGITRRTLAQWRGLPLRDVSKDAVRNISDKEVSAIYRQAYWDACRCDDLPSGVDLAVFDFAVNSGVRRACRYLQRAVGVSMDGIVGGITLRAVRRQRSYAIIHKLCDDRLAFLMRLKHWAQFGKGWSRRVEETRTLSASWTQ